MQRGLHHQATTAQAGNDAVAAREVLRQRAHAQRKLGQNQALLGDLVRQLAVTGRVHAVYTGANDGNGAAASGQGAFVGGGVYAAGQAANDGVALCGQPFGKGTGVIFALRGGVAAAHNSQHGGGEQGTLAAGKQQRRGGAGFGQLAGVVRVVQGEQATAGLLCPGQGIGGALAGDIAAQCVQRLAFQYAGELATVGRQYGRGAAKALQ